MYRLAGQGWFTLLHETYSYYFQSPAVREGTRTILLSAKYTPARYSLRSTQTTLAISISGLAEHFGPEGNWLQWALHTKGQELQLMLRWWHWRRWVWLVKFSVTTEGRITVPRWPQEDKTEKYYDDRRQDQSIQREPEPGVNPGKEFRRRQAAISIFRMSQTTTKQWDCQWIVFIPCKCKDHATAGSHHTECSEYKTDQRQPQSS